MRRAVSLALTLSCLVLAAGASADESSQSLSIAPFGGAFVKLTGDKQVGSVAFEVNHRSGFKLQAQASAPIDDTSRRAAFLDENALAPGVTTHVFVGYDSSVALPDAKALSGELNDPVCKRYWAIHPGGTCDPEAVRASEVDDRARVIPRGILQPWHWSVGLDLTTAYDQTDVYKGDLAGGPSTFSKSDLKLGVRGRLYYTGWLMFASRLGWEGARTFSTTTLNRCTKAPSSDPNVSGSSCGDVLYAASNPTYDSSFFQELVVTAIAPADFSGAAPGLDAGLLHDRAGGVDRLHYTFTAFLAPTSQPVVTRFGVGLEIVHALDDDPSGAFRNGKLWYVPFLLLGAAY